MVATNELDISSGLTEQILAELRKKIGPRKYMLWFDKVTKLIPNEGKLELISANKFIEEWIRCNYAEILGEIIRKVAGYSMELTFAVDESMLNSDMISKQVLADRRELQVGARTRRGENYSSGDDVGKSRGIRKKFRNTLETFVVGSCNRLAYNAIISVLENVRSPFNPLFIYGGCGLGKTHLLQGLCNAFAEKKPEVLWCYISGEEFTNQFVSAVKNGRLDEFRNRYRNVDVLVIDDVHFLANKRATQEEFLHTYNAVSAEGKQVVLSSDTHPRKIKQFSNSLIDRCISGMVVEVTPPDKVTRVEIIRRRTKDLGYPLSDQIIDLLANHLTGNVRELEGAILKLYAYSSLCKAPIDIAVANQIIEEYSCSIESESDIRTLICAKVAEYFKIDVSELYSGRRTKLVAYARAVAMYLLRKHAKLSFPEIARFMGGKNHSTVVIACQKIEGQLKRNEPLEFKDVGIKTSPDEVVSSIESAINC